MDFPRILTTSSRLNSVGYRMKYKISNGDTYGRLLVLSDLPISKVLSKRCRLLYQCQCLCGKVLYTSKSSLTSGNTSSCGCYRKEATTIRKTTHGGYHTTEYKIYFGMRKRCLNSKSLDYPYYGGNGVTICQRWLDSFENFIEDMGPIPKQATLNRKNSSKIYSKETCEWVSRSIQSYDQTTKKTNKSGKTGVSFDKKTNKWNSKIGFETKSIHLGRFSELDQAILARKVAEVKYYGKLKGN